MACMTCERKGKLDCKTCHNRGAFTCSACKGQRTYKHGQWVDSK